MKRKELSKLIAFALATSVVLNSNTNALRVVNAETRDVIDPTGTSDLDNNDDDDNSDNSKNDIEDNSIDNGVENSDITSNAEELSGVSAEQMQNHFLNQSRQNGSELRNVLNDAEKSSPSIIDGQNSVEQEVETHVPDFSKFIYLSDVGYDTDKSSGSTRNKDKAVNGSAMTLDMGEEGIKIFSKGYGVQAPSSLVFDIGDYSDTKTILSTYIGIDNSQVGNKGNGNADGSTFKFFTSSDGNEWIQVSETYNIKQGDQGKYLRLNVSGAKYLKIEIGSNRSDWWDHANIADLRLIEDGYDVFHEASYTGFKTVAEYDSIISDRTVEDNYQNHKKDVLEREFVNRVGYNNILAASKYVKGVSDALQWLQSDVDALQLFIEAGGYYAGSGYNALVALGSLYNAYKDDVSNTTYRKMLLGTAVAYSREVKNYIVDYGGSSLTSDPVTRYKIMKGLYDNNKFIRKSEFENYPMELVRIVMGARLSDDEIEWLRNYIDIRQPNTSSGWRYTGYGYVPYIDGANLGKADFRDESQYDKWDGKYHLSGTSLDKDNPNGYGSKYNRIWMMMEAGGICWGITGVGNAVNNVQGIASLHTFQPGHQAEMTFKIVNGKGTWYLSNDVAGWTQSFSRWYGGMGNAVRLPLQWGNMEFNVQDSGNNSTYIILAQDALNNYNKYLESMYYTLIANSYDNSDTRKEDAYNKALESYNKNVDATYGLIKLYKSREDTTQNQWVKLATDIARDYKFFPAPMVDLMKQVSNNITDESARIQINTLRTISLQQATSATAEDTTQYSDCKNIAKSLLGNYSVELATFSFSGEDANAIKLNSVYDDSSLAVRVSLDGGQNWLQFNELGYDSIYTSQHEIKLTDEQVAQINATDDILVGLMGVDTGTNYRIDIVAGKNLSSSLYKNDLENSLIGDTNYLEYRIDGEDEWHDYVGGLNPNVRFDGAVKVYFRYKAHDNVLQGAEGFYSFSEDGNDEISKYLQLNKVSLYQFSSQQNATDKAAKNIIDGNFNTRWHTTWDWLDDKKYISFEFDKVRFINKIGYMPFSDDSGEMKSGNVYVSMDGINWTKIHEYKNLNNVSGDTWKYIDLGQSYAAKYIKIDSTESYYKSLDQKDVYFAGRMMSFYEDTTQVYNPENEVSVYYSTIHPTNGSVTATLVLPEGCVANGDSEHEFTDNGEFVFNYTDADGGYHSITAKVQNIDKDAPSMTYSFDHDSATNQDVTMTITGFSEQGARVVAIEEVNINEDSDNYASLLREEGSVDEEGTELPVDNSDPSIDESFGVMTGNTYTFTENKTVNFKIMDSAGNIGVQTVTVNWIDKKAPSATIEYSKTEPTNQNVIARVVNADEEVTFVDGSDGTHEFTQNGEYQFVLRDLAGNTTTLVATVNNIDKTATNVTVSYSTENLTNEYVVATLEGLQEGDEVISEGGATHTFDKNGTWEFVVRDSVGNESRVEANVTWIDKEGPSLSLEYSTTNPTNGNVTVTLKGLEEGDTVEGNQTTYTFTTNGTHEFVAHDSIGNESRITAEVNWIDRIAPTATVEYDVDSWTNGNVTATLVSDGKEITVTNTDGNSNKYVFDKNGKFKFEFLDEAGNKGEAIAEVNWIDKDAPTAIVRYSTKNPTTGPVTVDLIGFSEDGVSVVNNEGKTSYTFTQNGSFEFTIVDRAGNETKVPVSVDWISDTAPNISVEYSNINFTNKDVTATLTGLPNGYEVISGELTHTFMSNGTYNFQVKDRDGNTLIIKSEVSWIDKEAPTATVSYSTTSLTNQDVIATLQGFSEDGVIVKNNGGSLSHTFTENGYFDFVIVDKAGNEKTIRAQVDNIDKVVPTATITFDSSKLSEGKVIAKLTNISEEVTITSTIDGSDSYEFDKNGTFKFTFVDKAGNVGEAEAKVDWIDFNNLDSLVKFENLAVDSNDSSSDSTMRPRYVRALFCLDDEEIEILNNNGSKEVVFDKNGTYTFKAKVKDTGYEFDFTVTVDCLDETINNDQNESPVLGENEVLPDNVVVIPPTVGDSNTSESVNSGSSSDENNSSSDSSDKDDSVNEDGSNDQTNGDISNNPSTDDSNVDDSTNNPNINEEQKPPVVDDSVNGDESTDINNPSIDDSNSGDNSNGAVEVPPVVDKDNNNVATPVVPPVTDNNNQNNSGNVSGTTGNYGNGSNGANSGSGSGSSGNGGNGSDGDPNTDDYNNVKTPIIPPIESGDDIGDKLTSGEQSYDKDDVTVDDSTSVDGNINITNKSSKNEFNFEGIIKDIDSTGGDVSLGDKVASRTITSSSSSLNSSTENSNKESSNTEDYSKDNTDTETSIDSSSINDNLSEESSHKGLLDTVVSTIGITLGAIFVWIRKLFGFLK